MTNQHPITPPLELVHQWVDMLSSRSDQAVFNLAAQWGADQELDACVNYIDNNMSGNKAREFRAIRRPKPPSLKEQALALVSRDFSDQPCLSEEGYALLRRALEALPNE